MSIALIWDDPQKTILCLVYPESWAWDHFYEANRQAQLYLNAAEHPTHIILNMLESGPPPKGALTHLRDIGKLHHPNSSKMIVVGASTPLSVILNIHSKLNPNISLRFASTLEDARRLIKQNDNDPGTID